MTRSIWRVQVYLWPDTYLANISLRRGPCATLPKSVGETWGRSVSTLPNAGTKISAGQITELQNHRTFGVRRDLCGSSSATLLPKQGHLQQAAQDFVQAGLEYLQRSRLHNLPGQPVPVLHHPQREEVLPHVQTERPVLQFVPLVFLLGTTEKSVPVLLTPTLKIFTGI